MAINKKLIHFKSKENFDNEVANGNILDTSIVFIQDTLEIYTHGTFYDGSTVDLSNIEEVISKIKTDGDGLTYLNDKGEYKIPLIIVDSEEELNALDVPEGTEAIVFYPEVTYTKEEVNNSEELQATVTYITIDGFDTSKVFTNTYTSSGSITVPCKSSKGITYNKIIINYNELGIINIWLNEMLGGDLYIYSDNTWFEAASAVYNFEMTYLSTLSEEQFVIFNDVIGTEYKYKLFSYALKSIYSNSGWNYSELIFNNNDLCNILELLPYAKSIFGNPSAGEVLHMRSGILLGASPDGYYTSFNGETITKYAVYVKDNWISFSDPIESYNILTEKDVNTSIPILSDGKVPIEQLPLITNSDGTKFLSDDGTYKTIEGGNSSSGGVYAEVNHGTSDTTFTLTPNTFHVWDEVATLDLSFGTETSGVANEYLFQFTSGATATTLTLPSDIKWASEPTIAENMIYQISVLKGLASVLEFSNAAALIENKATMTNASNGEVQFQYPVASTIVVNVRSDMNYQLTFNEGDQTKSVDELSVEEYIITSISPNKDSIYNYTF